MQTRQTTAEVDSPRVGGVTCNFVVPRGRRLPRQTVRVLAVSCALAQRCSSAGFASYNEYNLDPLNITWASHLAHISCREPKPSPIIAMMPLFRHSANTVAMIRHSLTGFQAAVNKKFIRLLKSQVTCRTCLQSKYRLYEIRPTGPARRLATR